MITQILARTVDRRLLLLSLLLSCHGPKSYPGDSYVPFPNCQPGQFIVVGADKGLGCVNFLSTASDPPVCPEETHVLNAASGVMFCGAKGTGTTNSELATALSKASTRTTQLDAQLRVASAGSATYCGLTSSLTGRVTSASGAGVAAINGRCRQMASCGPHAHLCSVYEMYESVATGVITSAMNIPKSWIYMASWSQEFSNNSGTQNDAGAGLADNCGGFTTADSSGKWYGTAVQWATVSSGQKALRIFSGPDLVGVPGTTTQVTNPGSVLCNSLLPAACCQ